ncbi:hypothetical protein [Rhodopseudomonas palustris]|uniref:DUF4381 domain-containing protein n=1 Tax=Rhodopseudomonas palustris (strain BisB18) TaxID=316056 RepID=Q214K0_RHOPB
MGSEQLEGKLQTVISAPTWTWAIPLVASLLALAGVLITVALQWRSIDKQLKSAHALKIAEMRQAWINDLRQAMAAFQSYAGTPSIEHHMQREFYEYGTKIELFMNPGDEDFPDLQMCMHRYLDARSPEEKYAANLQYVGVCQRILKREWEVLKAEVDSADRGKN